MARRQRHVSRDEAAELVALLERLEGLLAGSELSELEIEVGEIGFVLRKPQALPRARPAAVGAMSNPASAAPGGLASGPTGSGGRAVDAGAASTTSRYHEVVAPLTGIFYLSPSPEAAPYVRPGGEVNEGQVIGLIEAMKLFNEIKSDVRGRVIRIVAEHGALIKARQPLLEVEPA